MTMFKELARPFPVEIVSWRVGSTKADKTAGLALAYIDARDVMERLDAVCGPENWQCVYPHAGAKTVCSIGIKCGEEWIWKADGAGDSDVEAEKGALSDAFKRAAVKWGIGRYLYDVKNSWVEIEPMGRSFRIKDNQYKKLEALLRGTPMPESAKEHPAKQMPKAEAKPEYSKISAGIRQITETGTDEDLTAWYRSHVKIIEAMDAGWTEKLMAEFTEARASIRAKAA
jgi:hypothetical protein